MKLTLKNKETKLNLNGFCNYLYGKCYRAAKIVCGRKDLQKIQEFIDETIPLELDIWHIYLQCFNNLRTREVNYDYIIDIDPNAKIPNTPYTYLMFGKLIEYGNTVVNGTGKITKVFQYVVDNLGIYFDDYRRGKR